MARTGAQGAVLGMFITSAAAVAGCGGSGGGGGAQAGTAAAVTSTVSDYLHEEPYVHHSAMLTARAGHTVTGITGGLALVAGGRTLEREATDAVEVIDVDTLRCVALPDRMTTPRADHGAYFDWNEGTLYLLGGHDEAGLALDSVERWDVATRAFTPHATLPEPRDGARVVAAIDNGQVLVVGGRGQQSAIVFDLRSGVERMRFDLPGPARVRPQVLIWNWIDRARNFEEVAVVYGGGGAPLMLDLQTGEVRTLDVDVPEDGGLGGHFVFAEEDGYLASQMVVAAGHRQGQPSLHLEPIFATRDATPETESMTWGPITARRRPSVVRLYDRAYCVAGGEQNGVPVRTLEVMTPAGVVRLPELSGARTEMVVYEHFVDTVLFAGGVGPDGRPTALLDLVTPRELDPTAAFTDAQARAAHVEARLAELARLQAERDAARAEAGRLRRDLDLVLADIDAERQRVAGLETDLIQARQAQADAEAKVAALEAQVARLRAEIAALEAQVARDQAAIDRARDALRATQQDLAAAKGAQAVTNDRVKALEADLARVNADIASLRDQETKLVDLLRAAPTPAPAAAPTPIAPVRSLTPSAPAPAAPPPTAPAPTTAPHFVGGIKVFETTRPIASTYKVSYNWSFKGPKGTTMELQRRDTRYGAFAWESLRFNVPAEASHFEFITGQVFNTPYAYRIVAQLPDGGMIVSGESTYGGKYGGK